MEQASLLDLPDHSTLYAALLARNPDYEGRAYVGVTSTGIFCRLTCSARKPKSENCRFFASVQHCVEAGFRPCKRCRPMQALPDGEAVITPMLAILDQEPLRRWSERDIEQMGFDPSTVRRAFQRHFGRSFLEMARQRRLQEGIGSLDAGNRVIFAQIDAGFSSASGFRRAFAQLLGCPPSALRKDASLKASQIPTPLGDMIAVSSASHLHLLEFMDRTALPTELGKLSRNAKGDMGLGRFAPTEQIQRELDDFFALKSARFDTPLFMQASPFTQTVWRALGDIPAGQTRSYSDIARQIGRPNAVRAVARANGANQIALAIPCHRVIGADGRLTGYGGGLWRKQRLIEIEHAYAKKAINFTFYDTNARSREKSPGTLCDPS